MQDNLPPVRAFGTWNAPVTDDAEWIDAPTDLACVYCGEPFTEGDNGAIMPTGLAQHRECSLRSVCWGGIGHIVNHQRYCIGEHDPNAGLSFRQSAILVWRHCVDKVLVTEEELEALRGRTT